MIPSGDRLTCTRLLQVDTNDSSHGSQIFQPNSKSQWHNIMLKLQLIFFNLYKWLSIDQGESSIKERILRAIKNIWYLLNVIAIRISYLRFKNSFAVILFLKSLFILPLGLWVNAAVEQTYNYETFSKWNCVTFYNLAQIECTVRKWYHI